MRKSPLMIIFLMFSTFSHADVTNGLVGWWKLDEGSGTSAFDSSGNGNTGTLTNGPTWGTGKHENAVSFDGINDYTTIANSSSLNFSDGSAVTMCAWIYSSSGSTGSWQGIVAKRDQAGGATYAYGINFQTNAFQVYTSGSSGIRSFVYNPTVNVWTHVCAVVSASPTALYINSALFGTSGAGGGVASYTHAVTIGSSYSSSEPFAGKIDDVRIYNRALTETEIKAIYLTGVNRQVIKGRAQLKNIRMK